MGEADIVLVNTNRMRPPIGPIALDYLAGVLARRGLTADLIDLAFAGCHPQAGPTKSGPLGGAAKEHPQGRPPRADALEGGTPQDRPGDPVEAALNGYFAAHQPRAVGVTFRNTDDCYLASRASFVAGLVEIVEAIRAATDAPIILGGSGYSLFPAELLALTGADYGVVGDGEAVLPAVVEGLKTGKPPEGLPGLASSAPREGAHRGRRASPAAKCGTVVVTPPRYGREVSLATERAFIDNARYFREGGQGGFETRRGCGHRCIYCADPVAKGRAVRRRPPAEVAQEVLALLKQGVNVLHTCDPEFNIPPDQAQAVCAALIDAGLGGRVRWYTYCSPAPFPAGLAEVMRRAGCAGVNFGADSACDAQLARLGRGYGAAEVAAAVRACKQAGLAVMIDLLFGGPGETPETCAETIAFIKSLPADAVGAPVGVRLYPATPLALAVLAAGPLAENPNLRGAVEGNDGLLEPVFYVDRALGDDPAALIIDLIAGDERFFPPVASRDVRDCNYNDNAVLTGAIAAGARGAYWHILRNLRGK